MDKRIEQIQETYIALINTSSDLGNLDEIFLKLFGKSGEMTKLPKEFTELSREELHIIGPLFNKVKLGLEKAIADKRLELRQRRFSEIERESLDLSEKVEINRREGMLHPLTVFENQIVEIFKNIGFQQFDAPLIDTDYYNFEVLNIPDNHPARDLWDTLYIDSAKYGFPLGTLLLRTHTSNSQNRIMTQFKPPFRMMCLGRCFRYENLDARHEHTFDQFELVYVDKGLSMANLQYLSEYFLKSVLGEEVKVRLKPKYYPFVEPGVGIDGMCIFCNGKGCKVCGEGWLELGGAGMIHPNVLKNGGIDPDVYSGIAWGPGLERILMLKLGLEDVRAFRSGDMRLFERLKGKTA